MLLYYALTMGQDLFALNLYSYSLLSGLFEMPGVVLVMLTINWAGRRSVMVAGLILCSVSLALCKLFAGRHQPNIPFVYHHFFFPIFSFLL